PPFEKQHQFDFNEILALLLSANPNLASQLRLRQLDNDTLFDTYINELKLRNLSPNYTKKVWELLSKFKAYLNQRQPTPELAKSFLAQSSFVTSLQRMALVQSYSTRGQNHTDSSVDNIP
ncbi:MAG TPA: hypothetical protein VJ377_01775, partial [Dehalococcoidales bacterium]|nr:hypothetical protein [Dehalococcoidales bacterium]